VTTRIGHRLRKTFYPRNTFTTYTLRRYEREKEGLSLLDRYWRHIVPKRESAYDHDAVVGKIGSECTCKRRLCKECYWRSQGKYLHRSGRVHSWPEPPPPVAVSKPPEPPRRWTKDEIEDKKQLAISKAPLAGQPLIKKFLYEKNEISKPRRTTYNTGPR